MKVSGQPPSLLLQVMLYQWCRGLLGGANGGRPPTNTDQLNKQREVGLNGLAYTNEHELERQTSGCVRGRLEK